MKNFFAKYWTEFGSNSSINALRYPFNARLSKLEQYCWRKSILTFIVAYCFVIVTIYSKWSMSPVVITYSHSMRPLWEVPFPAVTICPMTKVRVDVFNLTEASIRIRNRGQFSDDEYAVLSTLSQVCPFMWFWYKPRNAVNKSSEQILRNVSLSINDIFAKCYWRHLQIPCWQFLSPTMTESGICYTFNQISTDQLLRTENLNSESYITSSWEKVTNWKMETGYDKTTSIDGYPLRPISKGFRYGLTIIMRTRKIDKEYLCEGPNKGFKILIHPPDEYSTLSSRFFRLPFQQALLLTVKPQLTTISRDLKKHDHERRQCYFNDERYLRFFKIYNSHNCILECIANLTDSFCHCDKISKPRGANTPLCNAMKDCPEIIQHKLENLHQSLSGNEEWIGPCECLPSCVSLQYDVEVSRTPFDPHTFAEAIPNSSALLKYSDDYAMLAVGFKSKWILPLKRCELMNLCDLMAQIGGLFGLMMGASVISLVEILYFCLFRPLFNIFRNNGNVHPVQTVWMK